MLSEQVAISETQADQQQTPPQLTANQKILLKLTHAKTVNESEDSSIVDPIMQTIDEVIAQSRLLADSASEVNTGPAHQTTQNHEFTSHTAPTIPKRKKIPKDNQPSRQSDGVSRPMPDTSQNEEKKKLTDKITSDGGAKTTGSPSLTGKVSSKELSNRTTLKLKKERKHQYSIVANGFTASRKRTLASGSIEDVTPKSTKKQRLRKPSMGDSLPQTSQKGVSPVPQVDYKPRRNPLRSGDHKMPDSAGKLSKLLRKKRTVAEPSPVTENADSANRSMKLRGKVDRPAQGKKELSIWTWKGKSFPKLVYSETERRNVRRMCYAAVKHVEGEVVKLGDCVLLRPAKGQKSHVGKVAALWDDEQGEKKMTTFWFWRPEEVETRIRPVHGEMEVYVSNLRDENFVGCIDEKCFVLTAKEYASFVSQNKENDLVYRRPKEQIVPHLASVFDELLPQPETDPEVVYFADRGYDGKTKRFWGYYFRGSRLRKYPLEPHQ